MTEPAPARGPSPGIAVLMGLRFLLELALLAAYTVSGVRLVGGWLGWVLGIGAACLVAVVWGVLLAPRRRVSLPLVARLVIEAALFVVAGALLVASGLTAVGIGLVAANLVVVGLLRGPDKHAL